MRMSHSNSFKSVLGGRSDKLSKVLKGSFGRFARGIAVKPLDLTDVQEDASRGGFYADL